jgi:hypothetical protein
MLETEEAIHPQKKTKQIVVSVSIPLEDSANQNRVQSPSSLSCFLLFSSTNILHYFYTPTYSASFLDNSWLKIHSWFYAISNFFYFIFSKVMFKNLCLVWILFWKPLVWIFNRMIWGFYFTFINILWNFIFCIYVAKTYCAL